MSRKKLVIAAVTAVCLIGVFAYIFNRHGSSPNELTNDITIGAISPFTGDGATYGDAARTGIDLAIDEINAKGGINGHKIFIRYEDDQGNQADAVSAFNKLVSVDRVPAILGPFYSGCVLACAPVAERSKVVLLTGSATSDNIRNAGEFIFRVCPSNDEQARTIADFAWGTLKARTAFVVYRDVDYGVTLRDAFQKAFPALGGKIVGVEAVPADASDVRAQVAKIKQASPDFIFAAVHYKEGGALLRQAKELAVTAPIVGTDGGHDPQLIEVAGSAADGSYWATIGWGDEASSPAVAAFRKAYRDRYGRDPGVYSGLYYDAAQVLAKALVAAPVLDGPNIQRAMKAVEYDGPTGHTTFDEHGDVAKPFTIDQVKNGQFAPVH
ncbi:MAG: ABC transporter substrate-binding protein [Tepidisphaeraceae bacterium]|jgi:branched-chain amino acid transport system substrate-binding protein